MKEIDGILYEWDEITRRGGQVKGKKGRNVTGGTYHSAPSKPKLSRYTSRQKLTSLLKKSPEVMVKISGGGKDIKSIGSHLDYISRNGQVELEDEQGLIHNGISDLRALREDWKGHGIPYKNGHRKEAFNVVLSMPPGTDRLGVKNAAREFAKLAFEGRQYVFAAHEDEEHPHVHIQVKAANAEGVRLNPRKADLQNWREIFADKLLNEGIEAAATPRQARFKHRKAEKQVIRHINEQAAAGKRDFAKITKIKKQKEGENKINPHEEKIKKTKQDVVENYSKVARSLAKGEGEDPQLALQIVGFVAEKLNTEPGANKYISKVKNKDVIKNANDKDKAKNAKDFDR